MSHQLALYRQEMQQELSNILAYWMKYSIDLKNGGFYGKIDNNNTIYENAPKGAVLNARILWTFAAAYQCSPKPAYLQTAERAFKYLRNYFIDKKFGGIYWSVDHRGDPLDTKKQTYAIAFAIYAFSEYYSASNDERAKQEAIALYKAIEQHSYDPKHGGYFEALTRDWQEMADFRLSAKDFNEKKSMNTHLHVLEGYANLYKIWPDETLKQRISELIHLFIERIIHPETHHLILFFDESWNSRSNLVSYGHDIEAAWLLQEAAEIINDGELIHLVKDRSVKVAEAAARGLDFDGGLWYEKDCTAGRLVKEKHWWPQAEAMVGFYNAYQLTGDEAFRDKSVGAWKFVQQHLLNHAHYHAHGEWFWGVKEDYSVMEGEDKVGLWKCCYHNGRACMELLKRIPENTDEKNYNY